MEARREARHDTVTGSVRAMAARTTTKQRYARRRKRRLSGKVQDLTLGQWAALCDAWSGCAYCGAVGVPLQKDCVLPISRGGRYTLDNVVPACRGCNTSKCNTEVTVWMRRKKLDEESFLIRQWEILAVVTQSTPVAEAKGGWEGADSALRPTASGSRPRSAPPP